MTPTDSRPAEDHVERRLAAVLCADAAGFSRLMGAREVETMRAMDAHRRELFEPMIARFGGRVVKTLGDGLLAEFTSAIEATACAVSLQQGLLARNAAVPESRRLHFRMGINLADIILENGDIFGDGVNIAARLEAIAPPGGICISRAVHEQVRDRVQLSIEDLGEQALKHIARPVHVFAISPATIAALAPDHFRDAPGPANMEAAAARRRSASVAVLPFRTLGESAGNDYFTDGVVEDIITALSQFNFLFVVARNSSFVYRNREIDARRIGRELHTRYLVDGSVRRAGDRLRVNVELIEARTAGNLWADHFDCKLGDIFDLQDDITRRIVTTIEPKVREAEIAAARRKPTANLDAYDYFLRSLPLRVQQSAEATHEAMRLLRKSLELDPHYAPALGHLASCYTKLRDQGFATLSAEDGAECLRLAHAAVEFGSDDAVALALAGHVVASLTQDFDLALEWIDRALSINHNLAYGWARSSMVRVYANRLDEAIAHARRAIELSPIDPFNFVPLCARGHAHLFKGEFQQAADCARQALRGKERPEMAYRLLVAALERLGEYERAATAAAEFKARFPRFSIRDWAARTPFTNADQRRMLIDALKRCGVPD